MDELKTWLSDPTVRGVVRSATGEVAVFRRPGVVDLYTLLVSRPEFLRDALVADRAIGRGAAFLLAKGHVREVFAALLSEPAQQALKNAGIPVTCNQLVDNIRNRTDTDICPVEKATLSATTPDEALPLIHDFLKGHHIIP